MLQGVYRNRCHRSPATAVAKEKNMSHPNECPVDALEVHPPPLPAGAPQKASTLLGSVEARRARKWALGLIVAVILAAIVATSAAFAQTTTPCYEAYRMSGFNPQQTSFEEFRGLYGDTSLCEPGGRAR
jgi:hypothetical protein